MLASIWHGITTASNLLETPERQGEGMSAEKQITYLDATSPLQPLHMCDHHSTLHAFIVIINIIIVIIIYETKVD
jgi:hypothetical protein